MEEIWGMEILPLWKTYQWHRRRGTHDSKVFSARVSSSFLLNESDQNTMIPFWLVISHLRLFEIVSFPFFFDDRCTNYVGTTQFFFTPAGFTARGPWILLNLVTTYSLFGLICSLSFWKFCLHLGALTILKGLLKSIACRDSPDDHLTRKDSWTLTAWILLSKVL